MKDKLHELKSVVDDLQLNDRYYDEVPVRWFVVSRSKEATAAFNNVVKDYLSQLESNAVVPTISKCQTYFTHEESEQFREYLAREKGWSVTATYRKRLDLAKEAVLDLVYPRTGRWRMSYLDVFEDENYDLSFNVSGCCDFRRVKSSDIQEMKLGIKIDRTAVTRLFQTFPQKGEKLPEPVKSAIVNAIGQFVGSDLGHIEIDDGAWGDLDDDGFEEPWLEREPIDASG